MIRVLVVDDSAVVRQLLAAELSRAGDVEVLVAVDPFDARDKVLRFAPDVITLDIEMPRMDGISFLARLMKYHPVPVIVVSSLTPRNSDAALRALELGAIDVLVKPSLPAEIPDMTAQLLRAIRGAALIDVTRLALHASNSTTASERLVRPAEFHGADTRRVIVIGASTGGPVAIEQVLAAFPTNAPGVVIVQHMPVGFTAAFARRLDSESLLEVREAVDGDLVQPGVALVAPGGQHTLLRRGAQGLHVAVRDGPPVHYQRPAVDVLFHSAALAAGADAVGVLLTGMGADGASGLHMLREAGACTIAQDQSTSVVFSMPHEAIRLGAACQVLPLPQIGAAALAAATLAAATPPAAADRPLTRRPTIGSAR
jgi:two-component system, chemotaxis family, protein-glutamate methylesterase/glutaminase